LEDSDGWKVVSLVGNPLYYSRFGFEMAKPRGLSCGGPHDPFLQVLELEPGALAGVTGHVVFHPAFAGLNLRSLAPTSNVPLSAAARTRSRNGAW